MPVYPLVLGAVPAVRLEEEVARRIRLLRRCNFAPYSAVNGRFKTFHLRHLSVYQNNIQRTLGIKVGRELLAVQRELRNAIGRVRSTTSCHLLARLT